MLTRNVFHVYVDESSQTGHGFMVIGAIFCSKDAAPEIAEVMNQCLATHRQRNDKEFHWTELKGHTLELYKDVLAKLLGFTLGRRKMRYRALVVDMKQVDHSINGGRDREATLAKFIFTLVFGFARSFGPNIQYHVWIDKRANSVHDLEMDKRTLYSLNNEAKSKFGWEQGPFVGVKFVELQEEPTHTGCRYDHWSRRIRDQLQASIAGRIKAPGLFASARHQLLYPAHLG